MTSAFDMVDQIFWDALQLDSEKDRSAYLDRVCGGDQELRQLVERLLRAQPKAAAFLEQPFAEPTATTVTPIGEAPGTVIGPYKLIEQIGEGGMGTVWMAQQTEPVKCLVAVKLIKAGMDSRQVIARFGAERQALALMDHPHIAKVLDAGATEAGRSYFVMDLVKGVPITRYCDEHHLTPRQRLELFIPVCQAVQHAHQKGVIHRDLKPSNVLVALYDGKPVPKVIDFGVAKAAGQSLTEQTLITGFGNLVGTLEYMSPEQAEVNQLDIDTRSDIYSLGVLLYELLTGSPPFSRKELEQAGMLEMLRVIREQEPPKPSTKLSTAEGLPTLAANRGTEPAKLTKLVRGELDWIVMKALEKDRGRRYETANGLAMDAHRYLADEPVQACPPSAGYRLRKFVRRNKGAVVAVSLVLLSLVGGIIGTTSALLRATRAEADAVREAGEKGKALGEKDSALATARANEIRAKAAQMDAQENLKEAVAAVDQMLLRVGNDRLRRVPQMEAVRRELVQDAVKFYSRFLERNGDDPMIRREAAVAYRRLADLYRCLGQHRDAEAAYRRAFALFDLLEAQTPLDPDTRNDLVMAHIEFAYNHGKQGKRAEDEASIRRAVRLAERLPREFPDDPRHGDQLVSANIALARLCPSGEAEQILRRNLTLTKQDHLLGQVHTELGRLLAAQGRLAEAEQAASEAAKLWEQVVARDPSADWAQSYLADTLSFLADCAAANGRLQESAGIHGRAVAILDRLTADYPGFLDYRGAQPWAHYRHAGVLRKLNRTADAERSYRRALELFEKMAADFPDTAEIRQTALDQRLGLGQFLTETGRAREAMEMVGAGVVPDAKGPADLPGRLSHWKGLIRTHIELGRMLTAAGKHDEAQAAYREALAVRDRLEEEFADKAEFQRDLAASYLVIAFNLKNARRIEDAVKTFQMALSHAQQWVVAEPRARDSRAHLANVHLQLATMFRWDTGQTQKVLEESEKAARQSLALYDELAAEFPEAFEFPRGAAECVYLLATTKVHQKQYPKSEDLCRQAVARYQRLLDWPENLRTDHDLAYAEARNGQTHLYLARTLGCLRRPEAAAPAYERSVSLMAKAFRDTVIARWFAWERGECHESYGLFLAENGGPDEAERQFRECLELNDTAGTRNELAWKLATHTDPRVQNRFAVRAVELAKEAAALEPNNWAFANTLGVAHYRAGDWSAAIAALEESIQVRKGGTSFDWFFLAMAHWQLGEKDKAREHYNRAVQWMEKNQPKNEELRRFRAEAAELLELKEKK